MDKEWNLGDKIWLIFAILSVFTAIICKHAFAINKAGIFDIASDISAILGVTYVVCIAKQERKAYLFGIGNVLLYSLAVYSKNLYISTAYNLLYSFPILIYGYINWGKIESKEKSGIKEFTLIQKIIGIFLMTIAVFGLSMFSKNVLGGKDTLMDAIVSVSVCVATFLLTKKYVEQWLLFIVSNFMGIILFFPKSFNDLGSIDLFVMWTIYFINSFYGYVQWKKTMKEEENKNA